MGCGSSNAVTVSRKQEIVDIYIQELQLDDYEIGDLIGDGALSKVFSAHHIESGENVALKFFGYTSYFPDLTSIKHEIELMVYAGTVEGIVKTFGYFMDTQTGILPNKKHNICCPVIVMERLTGGELFELVRRKQNFSEVHAADIFKSITTTVSGLHRLHLLHST
jgi:serine/threonine protein kinase